MTYQAYPRAYHDFDHPQLKLRVHHGLAYSGDGSGTAHTGTDPAARADATARVPAFSPAEAVRADENENQAASSLHPAPLTSKTDPLQRIRIKSWAGRHDAIILPPSRGLFA